MVIFETSRLYIRYFKDTDGQDLYEYLSDEEVVKYEPYNPYDYVNACKEASRRSLNKCFYAVCLKENNKLIGNLYLSKGDFNTWELGYVFNKNYQRLGYAYESAAALIKYAFCTLNARRIIAQCNPLNERSWKLLERLGMRLEGHLRKNIYFKTDQDSHPIWCDTYIYALLNEEFRP